MGRKKLDGHRTFGISGAVRFVLVTLAATFVLVLVVVARSRAERFLSTDSRFVLRPPEYGSEISPDITVSGTQVVSPERIQAVFRPDNGRSIYLVPLQNRQNQLLRINWVRSASVARVWPNSLRVSIQERVPVAFVEVPPKAAGQPSRSALIDEDGEILNLPESGLYELPLLTGTHPEQAKSVRRSHVAQMLRVLEELGDLAGRVSEIDVSDPVSMWVICQADGDWFRINLGDRNFRERLKGFLDHLPEVRKYSPGARQFDLSVDGQFLAPGGGEHGR